MSNINFVAVDFETANNHRSSACSIGLAFVENGVVVESKHFLIKPYPNYYCGYNTEIHGITEADTKDSPTFSELWPSIFDSIKGKTLSFHFSSFDVSVLKAMLQSYSIDIPTLEYVCSYVISHKAFPALSKHTLKAVCEHIGHEMEKHHNAESDAIAAAVALIAEINSCGACSVDDAIATLGVKKGLLSADLYKPCSRALPKSSKQQIIETTVDPETINKENPLYGKEFVFTGAISVVRSEVQQLVVNYGGICPGSVRKTTSYLVCGIDQIHQTDLNTGKLKKAIELKSQGSDIEILTEDDFWEIVSLAQSYTTNAPDE